MMINNVDTQYSKDIINSAIDEGKLVATLGATLDNIIRETSIAPLMSSLGILDKEDMAELVESLISITHLNRRITMSENTCLVLVWEHVVGRLNIASENMYLAALLGPITNAWAYD